MKKGSELEYYFYTRWICKFCKEQFSLATTKSERVSHIKKYHDDEMDFEDHIIAHKEGKCGCSGVDITL